MAVKTTRRRRIRHLPDLVYELHKVPVRKRGRRGRILFALVVACICRYTSPSFDLLRDGRVGRIIPRLLREACRKVCVNWAEMRSKALAEPLLQSSPDTLPVYIITLNDSRFTRSARLIQQLMQQHIPYDFFFAVDGLLPFDKDDILNFAGPRRKKLLLKHYDSTKEIIDPATKHTRLQFGCYLTHVKLWRKLVQDPYGYVVVMEDDIFVVSNFTSRLHAVMQTLPRDWDLLYLNGTDPKIGLPIRKGLHQLRGTLGTFAYVISKSGAIKLLASSARGTDKPIDHMIDGAILSGQVMAYIPSPTLAGHQSYLNSTLAYF